MAWEIAIEKRDRERPEFRGRYPLDMTASISTSGGGRLSLVLGMPPALLKKARWVIGDRVTLYRDKENNTFLLKRGCDGIVLSPSASKKGNTKKLLGTNDFKAIALMVKPSCLISEKRLLTPCRSVSVEEEGLVFKMPEGFLAFQSDGENP